MQVDEVKVAMRCRSSLRWAISYFVFFVLFSNFILYIMFNYKLNIYDIIKNPFNN